MLRQVFFAVSTRKRLMGVKDFTVEVITLMLGSMEIVQGNVK